MRPSPVVRVALVYREKVLENLKIDISALSFMHALCPNHGESRFWGETDGESRAVDIPRALADKLTCSSSTCARSCLFTSMYLLLRPGNASPPGTSGHAREFDITSRED